MKSKELIKKILDEIDIVEFISRDLELNKKGNNYIGLCEFHEDDNPSFTVNSDKQICKCFSCGAGGNVISYYQQKNNLTFNETLKYFAEELGINYNLHDKEVTEENRKYEKISKYYNSVLKLENFSESVRKGLNQNTRNLIDDKIIGYAPSEIENLKKYLKDDSITEFDKFNNHLTIPINDEYKRCIGIVGSNLNDKSIEYIGSKEKDDVLINIDEVLRYESENIMLYDDFENYMNDNNPNILLHLTEDISDNQLNKLRNLSKNKKIIIEDNKNTYVKGTYLYNNDINNLSVRLKGDENNIKSFIQYKIDKLENSYDMKDAFQRNEYIEKCLENVEGEDFIKKCVIASYLEQKSGVSQEIILNHLDEKNVQSDNKKSEMKLNN